MKIKILSPVHIGNGEKKNRMAIIEKDNRAYFINEDSCASLINNQGLTDKFIQWARQGGNDISQFLKDYPDVEKELLKKPLYVLPIRGFIAREVNLHIKDTNNQFYIPGSSIKGAIRTALLFTVLEEVQPDLNELLNGITGTDIKGVLNVDQKDGKWVGMEIEKIIFRAGFRKEDNTISYNDAKYDFLKFIHFSDAYPIEAEFSIMPIRTFSSISKTLMNIKSYITNAEAIEKGELKFNLEIDMKGFLALKNVVEKNEWIGLKDKFTKVFGFNLAELKPDNLKEYEEKIIKRLFYACNKFTMKKKEKDLELIKSKEVKVCQKCGTSVTGEGEYPKCHLTTSKIMTFQMTALENNYPLDFPDGKGIIELGFGGGWKGKTVGLYFGNNIINNFRRRFRDRWSGKFVEGKPFWLFPKTIRLSFWLEVQKPKIFPLGWVRLMKE